MPCAPVPSVWLAEHLLGTWSHFPSHRDRGGRGKAAGWAAQALPNTSMAHTGGGDPSVTWMQGQVQKQRCGDLSFVHNPDESDLCKAEGRERGEKGEEKGEKKEGREESRHRQH